MAVRYEDGTTAQGLPLLIMHVSGMCDMTQAETLGQRIGPGGDYHGKHVLVFVADGTEYTPEARKYFPTLSKQHRAMATVVTSVVVRTMINLITRVIGGGDNFKMFTDEASARAWLASR